MFHFQQFALAQDFCAMKLSTDSVLLGAWTRHFNPNPILDIGTGTGILALIAAQRNPNSLIHAVEIDPAAARQAQTNAENSPFATRINIQNISLQNFGLDSQYQHYFHSIVSNPPYYDPQKFLTPPDPAREIARTTVQLAYSELFANVKKLLLPKGRFSLIIPVAAKADVFKIAAQNGFYLSRQTLVAYNPDKEPARILLELCPFLITPMFANFTVYQPNSSLFSPQYAALCHDLYLFPQ